MLAPAMSLQSFFAFAKEQGITRVEIRNDIANDPMALKIPARELKDLAAGNAVEIISINALQRFNEWNETREAEARALISYASACGAKALVMCPVNDHDYGKSSEELAANLRQSLTALKPILQDAGVIGLVEPLGFPQCSLRLKSEAVAAIADVEGGEVFRLVHDTFHHHLAGEEQIYPEQTGLVHISGVEDKALAVDAMLDDHRLLVGEQDRLGNVAQISALLQAGFEGSISFEPFAQEIHAQDDITPMLKDSIAYLNSNIRSTQAA
jgi:2-keto-myo-inositol isomerase